MMSKETKDEETDFPVDTLGIPILTEVIEPGDPEPGTDEEAAISDIGAETTDADGKNSREEVRSHPRGEPPLEEVIDQLAARISNNLLQALEPLIHKKINRALKKHSAEIAQSLPGALAKQRPGEEDI